jgi:hypothetical protein
LLYHLFGPDKGTAEPVSDPFNLMDIAISPLDGTGWGIGSDLVLYHQLADGTVVPVRDIAAYQAGDPDPADQEDNPTESNPYGLTVMKNGDALVADAAGNDLIRVTPGGDAFTVARFDIETISTDHLGPEFGPLPPTIDAEAVPTSVAIGPDGAIYVGELKGFPFRPGTSRVWRIDADAEGALCSATTPDDDCGTYKKRLTAIQDITFGHGGKLYVYELAEDGVLAFEAGFETGEFPPAVLLEIKGHHRREIAKGKLSQPGGVASRHGKVYVTDGIMGESTGRLLRVR